MRCDANVSVRRPGEPYGTRCEIKNLNSVRYVMQAIEYEARRQVELIEEGGRSHSRPASMMSGRGDHPADAFKGGGARLPLFPRPRSAAVGARPRPGSRGCAPGLPELPDAKKARFVSALGLVARGCGGAGRRAGDGIVFRAGRRGPRPQGRGELGHRRSVWGAEPARHRDRAVAGVARAAWALIDLIADGTISGRLAKDVFAEMVATGADPAAIVEKKGCAKSPTKVRSPPRSTQSSPPNPTNSPNTAPAATSSTAFSSAKSCGDPRQSQPRPGQRIAEKEAGGVDTTAHPRGRPAGM